jgi:hypothetical protein
VQAWKNVNHAKLSCRGEGSCNVAKIDISAHLVPVVAIRGSPDDAEVCTCFKTYCIKPFLVLVLRLDSGADSFTTLMAYTCTKAGKESWSGSEHQHLVGEGVGQSLVEQHGGIFHEGVSKGPTCRQLCSSLS